MSTPPRASLEGRIAVVPGFPDSRFQFQPRAKMDPRGGAECVSPENDLGLHENDYMYRGGDQG